MRRVLAALLLGLALLLVTGIAMAGPKPPSKVGPPPGCIGYEGLPGNNACH